MSSYSCVVLHNVFGGLLCFTPSSRHRRYVGEGRKQKETALVELAFFVRENQHRAWIVNSLLAKFRIITSNSLVNTHKFLGCRVSQQQHIGIHTFYFIFFMLKIITHFRKLHLKWKSAFQPPAVRFSINKVTRSSLLTQCLFFSFSFLFLLLLKPSIFYCLNHSFQSQLTCSSNLY